MGISMGTTKFMDVPGMSKVMLIDEGMGTVMGTGKVMD